MDIVTNRPTANNRLISMNATTKKRTLWEKSEKARALITVFLITLIIAPSIKATSSGGTMPWDGPLQRVVDNLTGPTAQVFVIAMFVIGGLFWGFSGNSEGAKKFGQAIIGTSIIIGAPAILTTLGLTTTLIM